MTSFNVYHITDRRKQVIMWKSCFVLSTLRSSSFLRTHRKYAFLLSFIIASLLVIFYEVSIGAVWLFGRMKLAGFDTPDLVK